MTTAKTVRLTTAQALVRFLVCQFTERDGKVERLIPSAFGIFGHGNVAGLGDALRQHATELPFYQPCNEQGMVHAAIGFAKERGRRAAIACTSSIGPGATNMVTGAATATVNRIPVLLLPADYFATRNPDPALQQLEHPISRDVSVNDCFRPVSRFFDRVSRPEQLPRSLIEAMRVLTDPIETGAVTIALPQDVQTEAFDFPTEMFERRTWRIERARPDQGALEEAVGILTAAKRPAVVVGGGVHYAEASSALERLAQTCGIPVGESFAGKGAMPGSSPMLLGGVGITGTSAARKIMETADVVLCVGTRLADFTTGSRSLFQNPSVRFIGLNVSRHDACKLGALPLVGDARETLEALTDAAEAAGYATPPHYRHEIEAAQESWSAVVADSRNGGSDDTPMRQSALLEILNDEAKAEDVVVAAAGSPPGDVHQLWDSSAARDCHLEFGFSCMGYEIPGAIGARLARPKGEIYAFIGDGTYLMSPSELVTAVREKLKITVVISNNHGYQVIRRLQEGTTGTSFANEMRTRTANGGAATGDYLAVDFVKNAESLGARAWEARSEAEVRVALREARQAEEPCVIVVETPTTLSGPDSGVWWDAAPPAVSDAPDGDDRRSAYESTRASLQRSYAAPVDGPR